MHCARHRESRGMRVKKGTHRVCDVWTPEVDNDVSVLRTRHAAYLAEALSRKKVKSVVVRVHVHRARGESL